VDRNQPDLTGDISLVDELLDAFPRLVIIICTKRRPLEQKH
jgi:hypothetical protein